MNEIIRISFWELLGAAGLVAIAAIVSIMLRLKLEKEMIIGTVRAFVQLMIVGYVLDWIFALNKWYLVTALLLLMIATASYNAMRRQTKRFPGLMSRFALAIALSSVAAISLGIGLIVRPSPFWDPQYLIPIGGMIIGNTMSSGALAVDRLYSEIRLRRGQIEAALSLGASVHISSLPATRAAVKAGMLHIISTTMVVGIVHLPGMMTGQIIGGVEPGTAVRYQLIIMYILIAATALSSLISTLLIRNLFFTKRAQLIMPE